MLNAIALPRDWANYGALIDGFAKKYGIEVNDGNPDGASQDEINAITSRTGQDRAPDVVDPGQSFALSAAQQGLFAPPAGRPEVSRVTVPLAFGTWIRCWRTLDPLGRYHRRPTDLAVEGRTAFIGLFVRRFAGRTAGRGRDLTRPRMNSPGPFDEDRPLRDP